MKVLTFGPDFVCVKITDWVTFTFIILVPIDVEVQIPTVLFTLYIHTYVTTQVPIHTENLSKARSLTSRSGESIKTTNKVLRRFTPPLLTSQKVLFSVRWIVFCFAFRQSSIRGRNCFGSEQIPFVWESWTWEKKEGRYNACFQTNLKTEIGEKVDYLYLAGEAVDMLDVDLFSTIHFIFLL